MDGSPTEPDHEGSYALISGIADPTSFEKLILSTGLKVVKHFALPDHYPFTDKHKIRKILSYCHKHHIDKLICTSKDMVKLCGIPEAHTLLMAMQIGITPQEGDKLWDRIANRIRRAGIS